MNKKRILCDLRNQSLEKVTSEILKHSERMKRSGNGSVESCVKEILVDYNSIKDVDGIGEFLSVSRSFNTIVRIENVPFDAEKTKNLNEIQILRNTNRILENTLVTVSL